jgi:hypothetical protein
MVPAGSVRCRGEHTFVPTRSRRSLRDVREVFALKAIGLTDRQISTLTRVPINTIRTWRNGRLPLCARPAVLSEHSTTRSEPVPDLSTLPTADYAYLLGMYLGDGWLAKNGSSFILRITLDEAYPGIIAECEQAIQRVAPEQLVYARPAPDGKRCVTVACTWRAWVLLFPQHGPGRKHKRRIELADWQQTIVDAKPGAFLRGLIHTDGWRGLNRVHVKGRDYAYPRYQFSNRSDDIRRLFTDTCDKLGIEWRQWTRYHISVARRESVSFLDSFIGPKA